MKYTKLHLTVSSRHTHKCIVCTRLEKRTTRNFPHMKKLKNTFPEEKCVSTAERESLGAKTKKTGCLERNSNLSEGSL